MAELATWSAKERAGIETFVPIKPDRIAQLMRRERFRLGVWMTIPPLWWSGRRLPFRHVRTWAFGFTGRRRIPLSHAKQTA